MVGTKRSGGGRGFSLIELVVVVVILGILAAIAMPRMSRGAAGAADAALSGDLALLRSAIELYQTEHGGTFPDLVSTPAQLTGFTSDAGVVGTAGDGLSVFGPYMRRIPPLPVGADKGKTSIVAGVTAGNGWVYDQSTGVIRANCEPGEVDARGVPYNTY